MNLELLREVSTTEVDVETSIMFSEITRMEIAHGEYAEWGEAWAAWNG